MDHRVRTVAHGSARELTLAPWNVGDSSTMPARCALSSSGGPSAATVYAMVAALLASPHNDVTSTSSPNRIPTAPPLGDAKDASRPDEPPPPPPFPCY
ncbi:hypothetical protein HPB52_020748 [Rhipicephalus sanguineus]|uniref:Uncharacterized protein n=1 Tax=Rhipicephalus sanguineus TaxID=34632 RepID=A0A9D4T7X8_RHISA|nr:hypothetical protein HPB52_020748 [Rhipicephalus sanguineus]